MQRVQKRRGKKSFYTLNSVSRVRLMCVCIVQAKWGNKSPSAAPTAGTRRAQVRNESKIKRQLNAINSQMVCTKKIEREINNGDGVNFKKKWHKNAEVHVQLNCDLGAVHIYYGTP